VLLSSLCSRRAGVIRRLGSSRLERRVPLYLTGSYEDGDAGPDGESNDHGSEELHSAAFALIGRSPS